MADIPALSVVSNDGISFIPAKSILGKTGGGNKPFLRVIINSAVDATGAGITYTVTDPCALYTAVLSDLTSNDTLYTLTDRSSGKIIAEYLTVATGTTIPIVSAWASAGVDSPATEAVSTAPIKCDTGFTLFVKTTADSSITVAFSYLELA